MEAVLAEFGYDTATAMLASEAWSLIHKRRPRLILLDLLMPKISGFQLLERLKERPIFAKIPVIVVSAPSDADAAMRLKEMGADDFSECYFLFAYADARIGGFGFYCRGGFKTESLTLLSFEQCR